MGAGWSQGSAGGVQGEGRPQGAPAKPGPAASGRRNRPQDGLPCGRGPGWRRGREGRASGPQAQPVCFDAVETACGRLPAPLHKKAAHRLPLSRARAPQMRFQITFCFSHFPLKYRGR